MSAETPESVAYKKAYYAAQAADNAYQVAAVAEHGPIIGRWAKHTRPETIAAKAAKIAADELVRTTLKALHARVLK